MTPRPKTLGEIAERADSLEAFGRHFRDWLHELRRLSSRPQIEAAVRGKPVLLARRFTQGGVADAWLAAYAEYVSERMGCSVPEWANEAGRVSPEPWFATTSGSVVARVVALRDSPAAFKKRNLFTAVVDMPIASRAGRPAKSEEERRMKNAERQRRFRERRAGAK